MHIELNKNKIQDLFLLLPFIGLLITVIAVDSDLISSTIYAKYYWFYWSVGLSVLTTLFLTFHKRQKSTLNFVDLILSAFILYVTIHYFITDAIAITRLSFLILLGIIYYCFRVFFFYKPVFFLYLCIILMFTGVIEASWGMLQLHDFLPSYNRNFKITGSFFNPGPYGGYLAVILPMSLSFWLNYRKKIKENFTNKIIVVISFVSIIFSALIIPASMSRSAWLALCAGSLYVLIVYFDLYSKLLDFFRKQQLKHILLISSCVLLILALCFTGMFYLKQGSAEGRLVIWKASIKFLLERDNWAGIGLGHFTEAYAEAQSTYLANHQPGSNEVMVSDFPEYGFNEYLQIGIETGIVALLLFLLLLFFAFTQGIKTKQTGVVGALISFSVFSFFSYPFSILPFCIVFIFLLSATSIEINLQEKLLVRQFRISLILSSIVFTVLTSFLLFRAYYFIESVKFWSTVSHYHPSEQTSIYADNYDQLSDQYYFLLAYGKHLSEIKSYTKSNIILDKAKRFSCDPFLYILSGSNYQQQGLFKRAEEDYLKAYRIVPNRIYPLYLLAKLYKEQGDNLKMKDMAYKVIYKKEKIPSLWVGKIKKEMSDIIYEIK